ncbi:FG-GAP repeat domain-containing protein [Candidatus Omnitrophota bacterium]
MYKALLLLVCFLMVMDCAEAAYVAMAEFDINGDGQDEIIRTEGNGDVTTIKIYQKIQKSYFFKPIETITVQGNLVQVPEVTDLTGDGLLDLYFATGSDLGVVYYDTIEEEYKRKYEINEQLRDPHLITTHAIEQKQIKGKAESEIFLKMQTNDTTADEDVSEGDIPLKTKSVTQTI